jgi:type I restriction enzyme S subunit
MVPDGWHESKLGQLFKSRRARGKAGLPTLSVTLDEGLVRRDSLDRKMDTTLAPEEHLLVRKGDIAYNMMRMWQGASGLAEHDALVSPAYVVLEPTERINPLFASYLFKTPRMVYLFWAYSHGLTRDRLRLYFDDFSLIHVTIPSVEEQKKITQIVATWDRAIELVEKLIANSQLQKRSLLQALLTATRRVPGFESSEWHVGKLGDLCSLRGGSGFKENYQGESSGQYPFIKVSDFNNPRNSTTIREANNWINEDVRKEIGARVIPKHSVVFAKVGAALLSNRRRIVEVETIIDNNLMAAIPGRNTSTEFLYYLLQAVDFAKLVQEGAVPSINQTELAKVKVRYPSMGEQIRLAAILGRAEEENAALDNYRRVLITERNTLFRQLLTGKRRVKIEEEVA